MMSSRAAGALSQAAMTDHMGITPEHIGDSTGELEHLTDLS